MKPRSVLNFNYHISYAFNKIMAKYVFHKQVKWEEVENPVPPFQLLPLVSENVKAMAGKKVAMELFISGGMKMSHYCCCGKCEELIEKVSRLVRMTILECAKYCCHKDDVLLCLKDYVKQQVHLVHDAFFYASTKECLQMRDAFLETLIGKILGKMNEYRFYQDLLPTSENPRNESK